MAMESRWDSVDSYFLTNQLQSFDPQTRYQLVPGIVGRKIIPPIANASPNMPSYKYTMTKVSGSTHKAGKGRTKNAPTVNVTKEEVVTSIKTFENTASWSIDDIRAARETGGSLDMDMMVAAMTAIEQDFDAALCSGVSGTNITGIANNTAVSATAALDKGSGIFSWLDAATTGEKIAKDVQKLITDASTALKQAQVPGSGMRMFDQFVLFLPLAHYQLIDMTPRSTTSPSDTTILGFISKFSALKAIVPWWRLDTAGAAGIPKAVLAPALDSGVMNPLAGGALLPMDFERLPEQATGRMVSVPCAGKCGGVVIPYPVAFRYLTGL
jgi:hypothetical protein